MEAVAAYVCVCARFADCTRLVGVLQQIPENTYRTELLQSQIGLAEGFKSPEGQKNRLCFRLRACRFVFT